MTRPIEIISFHCHGEEGHPVEIYTVESADKNCAHCDKVFDGFKGKPKHDYDVVGDYAPSNPPKSGKPTGKDEQPARKGKP